MTSTRMGGHKLLVSLKPYLLKTDDQRLSLHTLQNWRRHTKGPQMAMASFIGLEVWQPWQVMRSNLAL
jgi:hypothetical protein